MSKKKRPSIIEHLIQPIYNIAEKRCEECPARWGECDYWGEYDEGCSLNKDMFSFCHMAFYPNFLVKIMTLQSKKWDEKHYELYGKKMIAQEKAKHLLEEAIIEEFKHRACKVQMFDGEIIEVSEGFLLTDAISHRFYKKLDKFKEEIKEAIDGDE